MAEMTSRERVWTALNHQEPDRVPLDIGGGSSTTIVVEGYEKFKHHLDVSSEIRIMNKAFRLARLDEEVTQRLGSNCRPVGIQGPAQWTPPPSEPGTFTDVWGITWRQVLEVLRAFLLPVLQTISQSRSMRDPWRAPGPWTDQGTGS